MDEEILRRAEEAARDVLLRSATEQVKDAARVADEAAIRKIVEATVERTLISLGIDPKSPIEAQKDASFLRGLRLGVETGKRQMWITIIIVMVTGFMGALYAMFGRGSN